MRLLLEDYYVWRHVFGGSKKLKVLCSDCELASSTLSMYFARSGAIEARTSVVAMLCLLQPKELYRVIPFVACFLNKCWLSLKWPFVLM